MSAFRLASFPLEQHRDWNSLERRLGGWCVDRPYPVRLLALSHRFDLTPARKRVEQRLTQRIALARAANPVFHAIAAVLDGDATADPASVFAALPADAQHIIADCFTGSTLLDAARTLPASSPLALQQRCWSAVLDALLPLLWPIRWLNETVRSYRDLQHDHLRAATYLMLCWEPPSERPQAVRSTLAHAVGRDVTLCEHLPRMLPGSYRPEASRLVPHGHAGPYYAGLLSYDVRGQWNARTLHTLLNVPYDVALAIDIHTVGRAAAMRGAELAFAASRAALLDTRQQDTAAERRKVASEYVQHQLTEQGWHEVQIAVLISGQTVDDLEANVADVQGRMGSLLSLTRVTSAIVQAEIPKFFTMTPSRQLNVPWMRRNMLSQGVGCCMGVLGFHRADRTDGIYWGIDSQRRAPLFFDLFARNQAAHLVILGMTGYGKTVFLNTIALRAASQGYRVIGLDAYRNGDRVERAAQPGARCYSLGLDQPLNILDVVTADEDRDTPGTWLPRQVQLVIAQLSLLLGDPGVDTQGRKQYVPRRLGTAERGVLDRALTDVYTTRGVALDTPTNHMPILSDLIDTLEQLREHEARAVARDLRMLIFGTDDPTATEMNSLGRSFNAHTAVDWHFDLDICYYDFSRVPSEWKAFYYIQAIGAIQRWMRDPKRDLQRRTLLQLDEFGMAVQVQAVLQLAMEITKTARKYRVGMMLIDQNPVTFLGSDEGRQIIENAAGTVMFHMADIAARQMGDAISALTPAHVQFIIDAQPGECCAVVQKDVYTVAVELNRHETAPLVGS